MPTTTDDTVNMGLEIFKRYQHGIEAVPEELPTPPEAPDSRGDRLRRYIFDQVRQGIIPDEALEEIKRNPTGLRAMMAYGEGALAAGTLLSGGGPKGKVPKGVSAREPLAFEQSPLGDFRAVVESPDKKNKLYFKFEPVHEREGAYRMDFSNIGPTRDPKTAFSIFREHVPYAVDQFQKQFNPKELYTLSANDTRASIYRRLLEKSGLNFEPIEVLNQKGFKISFDPRSKIHEGTPTESDALQIIPPRETGTGTTEEPPRQYVRGTKTIKGYGPTHPFNQNR